MSSRGVRHVQRLGELPGVHRRCAEVAGLAGLDDVVQRLHRLLDRRRRVPAVDLIEVDVVGAQAPKAGVDLGHDRLAGQAGAVRAGAHAMEHLGRDHNLVAPRGLCDDLTQDLFAAAGRIHVGRVEEVDSGVERAVDDWTRGLEIQRPCVGSSTSRAEAHAAEAQPRHFEPGRTQSYVLHRHVPFV